MALPKTELLFTVEEYLAMERKADERHEYLDGIIYAMAGESDAHADICMNLAGLLHSQLRGTPCRGRIANTKVLSGPRPLLPRSRKGLFSYPDLLVVCGEQEFYDEVTDVVLNPTVIFEVLSKSIADFDRGEKFQRYQMWNPELKDYVLVSQTSPLIEPYSRQPDGSWNYRAYRGLKATLVLKSIKCKLPLQQVYERAPFPPEKRQARAAPKKTTRPKKKKPTVSVGRKKR